MRMDLYGDQATVERVLGNYRTWAVVGLSENPERASHRVAAFLQSRGYRIIPVNPVADQILGEKAYSTLASVPEPVEVVDIFRRSSRAGVHVDEAIAMGAAAVWLQLGVVDEAAAERARSAGLDVIMDRCPAVEYPRMQQQPPMEKRPA